VLYKSVIIIIIIIIIDLLPLHLPLRVNISCR